MRRRAGDPKPYEYRPGRWRLDVQLGLGSRGHRDRRSLYGTSPDDVEAKRDELLRRTKLGLGPVDERLTVAAYLASWTDGLVDVRPRTVESYRHTVERHLIPALGTLSLIRLRAADIRRAVRHIQSTVGTRTAAYSVTILRLALGVAVKDRILERNEAIDVERPKLDAPERDVLDAAGIRALLDTVRGDRLEALWIVAATTGMRRGELLGLRWRDIDGATLRVAVQLMYRPGDAYEFAIPKTARSRRTIRLSVLAQSALTAHKARQRRERLAAGPMWRQSDLVFTTAHGGPLAGSTVVHALHRHLDAAGLPRQRFHDLRHAAATIVEPHLSRAEFLAMFGWTEGTTPARYTHASSVSQGAADAMDRLLGEPVAGSVAVSGDPGAGSRA